MIWLSVLLFWCYNYTSCIFQSMSSQIYCVYYLLRLLVLVLFWLCVLWSDLNCTVQQLPWTLFCICCVPWPFTQSLTDHQSWRVCLVHDLRGIWSNSASDDCLKSFSLQASLSEWHSCLPACVQYGGSQKPHASKWRILCLNNKLYNKLCICKFIFYYFMYSDITKLIYYLII